MWMSSPGPTSPLMFFSSYDSTTHPRPKRDLLLCVARHAAVTLIWDAPLSKAQSPGISVSRVEPSGKLRPVRCSSRPLPWFSRSSSRSLGHSLLLGQRSRMNSFSHHIGPLLHQDCSNPPTQLTRDRDNGHPRSYRLRMSSANRAEKFSELAVLADGGPGPLDEFTSKPTVSDVGNRSPIGSLSGRVLRGNQSQKPCQLADIVDLSPVSDARQKLARHNRADPGDAHQVLHTLGELGIGLAEAADLFGCLKNLLFRKLQALKQLIELKAHGPRTGK